MMKIFQLEKRSAVFKKFYTLTGLFICFVRKTPEGKDIKTAEGKDIKTKDVKRKVKKYLINKQKNEEIIFLVWDLIIRLK